MGNMKKFLTTYNKKMINLSEFEKMMEPYIDTYKEFSQLILDLKEQSYWGNRTNGIV